LRFSREDADELAAKLVQLRGIDRNAIGIGLRATVEERHSVDHWADEVLRIATPVSGLSLTLDEADRSR